MIRVTIYNIYIYNLYIVHIYIYVQYIEYMMLFFIPWNSFSSLLLSEKYLFIFMYFNPHYCDWFENLHQSQV